MEKTELAEKASLKASVKSPAREALLREGRGFSLAEIKKAGKTVLILKELNINIDYFRKSVHEWNVQQLKNLKISKKKKEKEKTYLPKEERIKARKRKAKKKVVKIKEEEVVPELEDELFYEADDVEIVPKKIIKKTKPAPKVKTPAKAKPAPAVKTKTPEPAIKTKTPKPAIKTKTPKSAVKTKTPKPAPKVKEEPTGIPLTKLSGFGSATSKKFSELGIHNVEELLDEDAEEIAMLISGVSADKIKKWIEEGKELLNK